MCIMHDLLQSKHFEHESKLHISYFIILTYRKKEKNQTKGIKPDRPVR